MKSRRERVASNRAAGTSGKDVQMTVLDINGDANPFSLLFASLVYTTTVQTPAKAAVTGLTYSSGKTLAKDSRLEM